VTKNTDKKNDNDASLAALSDALEVHKYLAPVTDTMSAMLSALGLPSGQTRPLTASAHTLNAITSLSGLGALQPQTGIGALLADLPGPLASSAYSLDTMASLSGLGALQQQTGIGALLADLPGPLASSAYNPDTLASLGLGSTQPHTGIGALLADLTGPLASSAYSPDTLASLGLGALQPQTGLAAYFASQTGPLASSAYSPDTLASLGLGALQPGSSLAAALASAREAATISPDISNLLSELKMNSPLADFYPREGVLSGSLAYLRPWLSSENIYRSIKGATDLSALSQAIATTDPYDLALTSSFRKTLGDFTELGSIADPIIQNPSERSALYASLGFNRDLTSFEPSGFDAALDITGIRLTKFPNPADAYSDRATDIEVANDTPAANVKAYRILYSFESHVRAFIDHAMTNLHGQNWVKQRTPPEMREKWERKKDIARSHGEPERPLICYADFTDYTQIIVRKDNWNGVFEPIFRRRESVQESFNRLFPLRICTMHARPLTDEDVLFLHVEVRRLLRAIKIN
jgi:hypothetical protein